MTIGTYLKAIVHFCSSAVVGISQLISAGTKKAFAWRRLQHAGAKLCITVHVTCITQHLPAKTQTPAIVQFFGLHVVLLLRICRAKAQWIKSQLAHVIIIQKLI